MQHSALQAPYTVALTSLGTHHPAVATAKHCGWCPDNWSLSIPKTIQLGVAGAVPLLWAKRDRGLLAWPAGGRGKLPQLPLTPEVGMAHCHWEYLNKNPLQPQPPQRAPWRMTLQENTTCYFSCSPGSTPTLLLPLPNALGSSQMLDHCPFPGTYN